MMETKSLVMTDLLICLVGLLLLFIQCWRFADQIHSQQEKLLEYQPTTARVASSRVHVQSGKTTYYQLQMQYEFNAAATDDSEYSSRHYSSWMSGSGSGSGGGGGGGSRISTSGSYEDIDPHYPPIDPPQSERLTSEKTYVGTTLYPINDDGELDSNTNSEWADRISSKYSRHTKITVFYDPKGRDKPFINSYVWKTYSFVPITSFLASAQLWLFLMWFVSLSSPILLFNFKNENPRKLTSGSKSPWYVIETGNPISRRWKFGIFITIIYTLAFIYASSNAYYDYLTFNDLEFQGGVDHNPSDAGDSYPKLRLYFILWSGVVLLGTIISTVYLMLANKCVSDAFLCVSPEKSESPFLTNHNYRVCVSHHVNGTTKIQDARLILKCTTKEGSRNSTTVTRHSELFVDTSNQGKTFYSGQDLTSTFDIQVPRSSYTYGDWTLTYELRIEFNPDYYSSYTIQVRNGE